MEYTSLFKPGVSQASPKDILRGNIELGRYCGDDFGDGKVDRHVSKRVYRKSSFGPNSGHEGGMSGVDIRSGGSRIR